MNANFDNTYIKYVPVEQLPAIRKKLDALEKRLKTVPVYRHYNDEVDECFNINDMDEIKNMLEENPDFNIDDSINARHASLFLMACYMCTDMEIPEFLVNNGASVYRTDVFGNNALILLILNDNMTKEQKLNGVAYLINEGADINWLNVQAQTPLTTALAKMELDIANYLIDRGAILYPAR